jgi:phosphate uptake regulator
VTISMKGSPVDGLEGVVIRCNAPNKGEYEVHLPNEEVKVFQSHQVVEVTLKKSLNGKLTSQHVDCWSLRKIRRLKFKI